jgi:hypothetical protein
MGSPKSCGGVLSFGAFEDFILKIGILSDIHVDIGHTTPDGVLEGLTLAIKKNGVDIMVIAGDIANDYQMALQVLNFLEDSTGVACLFVPAHACLCPVTMTSGTKNILTRLPGIPMKPCRNSPAIFQMAPMSWPTNGSLSEISAGTITLLATENTQMKILIGW